MIANISVNLVIQINDNTDKPEVNLSFNMVKSSKYSLFMSVGSFAVLSY